MNRIPVGAGGRTSANDVRPLQSVLFLQNEKIFDGGVMSARVSSDIFYGAVCPIGGAV